MKKITKYSAGLVMLVCTVSAQAMTIWVVESGSDPFSNSQTELVLSAGTTTLDLYYGMDGDISYGYDFLLDIIGGGSIANVGGGDSTTGNFTDTGWSQLGGSIYGEAGESVLGFSFDFNANVGSSLTISGSYIDVNFAEPAIASKTLATVSAVPLPAAAWLFISGLGLIGFTAKKKK